MPTSLVQDPYSVEAQEIDQRRKFAEALRQQAQTPLQTQMVGNRAIPISWTQGLAQGLKGYMGGQGVRQAGEQQKALAERMRGDEARFMSTMPQGTPAQTIQPDEQGMGIAPMQQPATQPTPQQYAGWLGGAPSARAAATGGSMVNLQQRAQENDENRAFRAQQAEAARDAEMRQIRMRLDDARTTEKDRAELRRELAAREEAARLERQKRDFEQERRMKEFMVQNRPPVQPVAPTMTEVVDPSNPERMLRIDARAYKGGSVGSPGVVGVSGKEPTIAKRQEKEGQGVDLLKSELDNLRTHYGTLNDAAAIPSDSRGGMDNAQAWVRSSTAGQLGGRIFGTKEQTARNEIQSARLRVLNAIKNATGMSSQQLNSNAELKTWLDSLTSMSDSYESNIGIIDAIEKAFIKKPQRRSSDGQPAPRVVDW